MLVFAHTGLTLGTAAAIDFIYTRSQRLSGEKAGIKTVRSQTARFTFLNKYVDIRVLLIGSMLPDIDKIIGLYLFRDVFSNGRIFLHTLVFLIVISLIGLMIYRKSHRTWAAVLAFGVLTHLVMDSMWQGPETLFWPLFGIRFPPIDSMDWIQKMVHNFITQPSSYLTEISGGIILLCFLVVAIRRKQLGHLILKGKIS